MPANPSDKPADVVHPVDLSRDAIRDLHNESERAISPAQRRVEHVVEFIGRPIALLFVAGLVIAWVGANVVLKHYGSPSFDSPPYFWLQGTIALLALLMDTIILITQNRQGQRAERRAQLDLQLSLAAEQRMAKVIDLLEELRRDMPNVRNRVDPVAEAMKNPADPAKTSSDLDEAMRSTYSENEDNHQHLNRP